LYIQNYRKSLTVWLSKYESWVSKDRFLSSINLVDI
jgi:hypothetical protein